MLWLDTPGLPRALNVAAPIAWEHPLNRGLVGWWLALPEVSGGARWFDLLGRTPGVLSGIAMSPTATSGWGGTTRPGGQRELRLDGTDDGVTLGNPPHLQLLNTLTVALWFHTATAASLPILAQEGLTSAWSLRINRTNTYDVAVCRQSTNTLARTAAGAWAPETWTHLVYTRMHSAAPHVLYLNGVEASLTLNTLYTFTTSGIKTLGYVGTAWFPGRIDDVQCYNRALSAAEVSQLYHESRLGSLTRLAWFPLVAAQRLLGPPPAVLYASVTTGVRVASLPTLRLPVLSALVTTLLTLATTITPAGLRLPVSATSVLGVTATAQLPRLPLLVSGSVTLPVTDTPTVVRALEGVLQVGAVTTTLALSAAATVRLPVLALAATSAATLTSSVTLRLPSLPLGRTESLAVGDTPTVQIPRLPLLATDTLAVTDTPTVVPTVVGVLSVGAVTTTLALSAGPTVRLPVLAAVATSASSLTSSATVRVPTLPLSRTESLVVGTTSTVRVPLLRLTATDTLVVTASATVLRTVEGLLQAGPVTTTLALQTTVTLRLPFLRVGAGSTLVVGALPILHSEVGTLHPTTGLGLATAVTMHLRLVVQASETLPVQATSSVGPTLVLLTTATLGVHATPALTVRLHAPGAESLALGTQVTVRTLLYPQASESMALGEMLTLAGVLRLTSTSAVSLETTAAFSVGLLYVQAGEVLPLTATSSRITGLSLRGLHAATPALRQGAMQGSLHQASGSAETLEQAEVDDAILV